ncbi:MAG: EF-hand domain-containing protein [Pirellulales bacterium]|nr:EF-hand domain-containing protein [Pirellulales bacterium]
MRKMFSLMAIAVAIVVLPTLAMAEGDKDKDKKAAKGQRRPDAKAMFERLDADGDGLVPIADMPERMLNRFGDSLQKADVNGDGKISQDEFKAMMKSRMEAAKANRGKGKKGGPGAKDSGKKGIPAPNFKAMFAQFDTDGDKKLSEEEFIACAKKLQQRIAARVKNPAARRGGHPQLSGPEKAKKMLENLEKRFDAADKNQDGKVTLEEAPDDMKERFAKILEKYDADGDKALTKEEGEKYANDMIKKLSQKGSQKDRHGKQGKGKHAPQKPPKK